MDIGMLWFDNDAQNDLNIKVLQAVSYYQKKYGQQPNLCFVHPCMLSTKKPGLMEGNRRQENPKSTLVEIKESDEILPNHFWIGIDHTGP